MSKLKVTFADPDSRKPLRVLVVEDDDYRCEIFKEMFKDDEVHWAKNAYAGVRALNKYEYDLVMLDHDLADEHYRDLKGAAAAKEGTGQEVARHMASMKTPPPFAFVHSWNPHGAKAIAGILAEANISHLVIPFGNVMMKSAVARYKELFNEQNP